MKSLIEAIAAVLKLQKVEVSGDGSGFFRAQAGAGEAWIGIYDRSRSAQSHFWCLEDSRYPATGCRAIERWATCLRLIVIDVDGAGDLGVDRYAAHLAAIDWAYCSVAALSRLCEAGALPRVDVLDLRAGAGFGNLARTGQSLLPSIVSYHAAGAGQRASGIESLLASILSSGGPDPGAVQQELRHGLRRWISNLTAADSRSGYHELNNSLGPLVLTVSASPNLRNAVIDCCDPPARLQRAAMSRALEWVVSCIDPVGAATLPYRPIDWRILLREPKFRLDRDLRILLLDDQAEEGWIPVLLHALGLGGQHPGAANGPTESGFVERGRVRLESMSVSLWVATDVRGVLPSLAGQIPKTGDGLPTALRLTPEANDVDELLLLDLRLFAGMRSLSAVERRRAEQEFFVQLHTQLVQYSPDFARSRSGRIGEATPDESAEYLDAMTWLARLIAAKDYTYPVIVWSSTGQRRALDPLKDIPSIYTGLEKPRLGSYGLENATLNTAPAIRASLHLIAARSFIRKEAAASPVIRKPYAQVDIYIDESGDNKRSSLWLGGLALVYQAQTTQGRDALIERFKSAIADDGFRVTVLRDSHAVSVPFRWGPSGQRSDLPANAPDTGPLWLTKDDMLKGDRSDLSTDDRRRLRTEAFKNSQSVISAIKSKARAISTDDALVDLCAFVVEVPRFKDSPFARAELDNDYYAATPYLLEALVAHVLIPWHRRANVDVKYALRVASRIRPLSSADRDISENWVELRHNKVGPYYRSITDQWVHSIAWTIGRQNFLGEGTFVAVSAPTINLKTLDDSQSSDLRLHMAADPIPRFLGANFLSRGFVDRIDRGFAEVLSAARAQYDDLGGALAGIERSMNAGTPCELRNEQVSMRSVIVAGVTAAARQKMTAADFFRYVRVRIAD